MGQSPFVLHVGALDREGCPIDPTSPVPPPWDDPPSAGQGGGRSQAPSQGRLSEVGAMLAKWARNPDLKPYEELFRSEPNEAWFDSARDPDHPTQFEIATVRPEQGQSILLFDYSVVPYGFSGVSALDYEPLPDDLISGVFGYSIRVNNKEPGQLKYRLQPIPSTIRMQSLRFNQPKIQAALQLTQDDFAISQANDYASAAGFGTGLHPQTAAHYGARGVPFTEYVHDEEVLTIIGVVFRPVEIPLAFVQARVSGFKGPSIIIRSIETALRAALR